MILYIQYIYIDRKVVRNSSYTSVPKSTYIHTYIDITFVTETVGLIATILYLWQWVPYLNEGEMR